MGGGNLGDRDEGLSCARDGLRDVRHFKDTRAWVERRGEGEIQIEIYEVAHRLANMMGEIILSVLRTCHVRVHAATLRGRKEGNAGSMSTVKGAREKWQQKIAAWGA